MITDSKRIFYALQALDLATQQAEGIQPGTTVRKVRLKMKTYLPKSSVWRVALAISGMFLGAAPASADGLAWNWDYKCSLLTTQTKCQGGSGTFTTTDQQGSGGNQYFLVTGITGTVEGNTITSLVAPDSLGESNDNKLSAPSGTPFANVGHKITGIAFLTNNDPATNANVNLLFNNFIDDFVGYYTQISGPNKLALENVDFSVKQVNDLGEVVTVPEPGSLLYIALGILMLGITLGKKLPNKESRV